jgi:hypothetical protein
MAEGSHGQISKESGSEEEAQGGREERGCEEDRREESGHHIEAASYGPESHDTSQAARCRTSRGAWL